MEDRKCTDVFCSIIFILVWAANIVIAVFAVGQGDLDSYFYGTDYQAQYCGKSGTDTASKSKVIMPRLDRDFYEQSATIASGAWWNFEPYKLCAEECPPKFTLKSAKLYGGPEYPNANDTAPSFFVPFETVDILGYCMPKADLEDGDVRQVCATPVCTNASVTAVGGTCTKVPGLEAEEAAGLFAWEVCPPGTTDENCAAQKAVCELEVKEDTKVIFAPPTQTAASQSMTAQFAGYVYAVDEFARSLMGALPVLMTCSLLLPVVMGFLWAVLIYLFASFMVRAARATRRAIRARKSSARKSSARTSLTHAPAPSPSPSRCGSSSSRSSSSCGSAPATAGRCPAGSTSSRPPPASTSMRRRRWRRRRTCTPT